MHRTTLFLSVCVGVAACAALVSSCCQPAHKDSSPVLVDSLFQESYGRDVNLFSLDSNGNADSAYFPIYTFGIQNSGSEGDYFTLQLQRILSNGVTAGFGITRFVPAGATLLFQTPSGVPDSITSKETFMYFPSGDTIPNLDEIYYGLSFPDTLSTQIQQIQPTLSVVYGAINNGPEGCNTPASTATLNAASLPVR